MTPTALAERTAAEKQAAQEKAELQKQLRQLPAQQKKEDAEAAIWLKSKQAQLTQAAQTQKAADVEAERQQAAQAQKLKEEEQSPAITTIRSGPDSTQTTRQQQRGQQAATQADARKPSQVEKQLPDQKQPTVQNNSGQLAQTMTASQFDQKYCAMASILQEGGYSASAVANQRRACVQEGLSQMPGTKGNCTRVEVMAGCGCYTVAQVQAEAAALGCSGYSTASLTLLPSLSPPAGSGLSNANGPAPSAASSANPPKNASPALSSAQIAFLRANSVSLAPQSMSSSGNSLGKSTNNFTGQPVAPPSFTAVPPGHADASIWDRLQNGVSFANSTAVNAPTFKAGVQDAETAAAVAGIGCAVGAAAGAVVGLGVGGIPGCGLGAVAATAIAGAATTGWQLGQSIMDVAQNHSAQGIAQAVQTGAQNFADSKSPVGGIVPTIEIAGTWGTYFMAGFYYNVGQSP